MLSDKGVFRQDLFSKNEGICNITNMIVVDTYGLWGRPERYKCIRISNKFGCGLAPYIFYMILCYLVKWCVLNAN